MLWIAINYPHILSQSSSQPVNTNACNDNQTTKLNNNKSLRLADIDHNEMDGLQV